MTNEIDRIRADIQKYFDPKASLGFTDSYSLSEFGLYYFETEQYRQADPERNWVISKIHIGHIEKDGYFFEYLTDNDNTCSAWIYKDNKDYLLFPEAQGGQSVFDVEERKLFSFYSGEDPFIWTGILISPDKTKLAVEGCYWACPFELVIYDCTDLTALPYPCLHRQIIDTEFQIKEWADDTTILFTSSKGEIQRVKI
jgi:hypothetical protein